MDLHGFLALASWLEENTALKESRNHFTIHQKLAIFLQIVGKADSNRDVQETFQHSGATISAVLHEVLQAPLILHKRIVIFPTRTEPLDAGIGKDRKYFPYFENCIGALDGTHLPAHVSALLAPPYRNRKGWLSQNVLGVCRMDLTFCYVLAEWEGSAHDDCVLEDALFSKNFTIPDNKYYFADAGYHNTDYLLCPYRGVRYHLKEVALAGKKPTTREELFNLRHSSLRNVVERIFGVTKRRFQIFKHAPEYSLNVQSSLVFVITALHNFIRSHQLQEDIYDWEEELAEKEKGSSSANMLEENVNTHANTSKGDGKRINEFRDKLVEQMWQDYIRG